MRAVKSVLLAAGSLRRLHPELSEDKIVLRAIIDVNIPKFLKEDVPLFKGIYTDLFPGTEVPDAARADIRQWLMFCLERRKLQATPWYVEKVMQFYEMMLVRHGLMVVGGSMGGKTTCWQTLAEVLKEVRNDPDAMIFEYDVNFRIINPKAISMGQLYGSFDPLTHEWTDGVLAKTFREMVYTSTDSRAWIMFDGPVDAVWIENLNTVLDDNKKLCLMSGEIIEMSKLMNMMFEPADLEQASPATVSRVGMIYMEPEQLGWQVLHKTFVIGLTEFGLNEIYLALYESLVNWLVPAILEILQSCKNMLVMSSMHQYRVGLCFIPVERLLTLCIFDFQILTLFFMPFLVNQKQLNQTWFQQTFLYCVAWAYGSALNSKFFL